MRDKIQSKVAKAFNTKLADAITTFTCSKEIQSGEFDFETQTYPNVTIEQYSGRGVFGSYKRDLVKPIDYQVEDVKATVLQNEVSGMPQIDDVWMSSHSTLKVLNVGRDPSGSIWIFQLRRV
ncbi:glutamate 5-kinase [Acinetobacter guillouiae]|uniref:glutamate 5-kinase n=1 Tax=Acinetobacter guillouiae TaxID=106649 RepID=UPI002E1D10C5